MAFAIPYKLYQNKNSKSKAYGKYYARAVKMGEVSTNDLAERIQSTNTLTKADILACISSFVEIMKEYLRMGYTVKLDNFGIFSVGLKSTGTVTPDLFNASKNIVGVHTNFLEHWTTDADNKRIKSFLAGARFKELAAPEEE